MEYVRIIRPRHHYDWRKKRLSSVAFKRGSDNAVSVIHCECIDNGGKGRCGHIKEYYPDKASQPIVFWQFSEDILPDGYDIKQKTSKSDDVCHHNVHNVSDSELRSIIIKVDLRDLDICRGDHFDKVNANDIKHFEAIRKAFENENST